MEALVLKIRAIRQINFEGRGCVPTEALYQQLPESTIRQTLENSDINVVDLDETSQVVFQEARKIFAILVMLDEPCLILNFIASINFQASPTLDHSQASLSLDHKLPLSEATLRTIVPSLAERFYELQWEYLIPTLNRSTLNRSLAPETILPFVKERCIGEGGFGVVYATTMLVSPLMFVFGRL